MFHVLDNKEELKVRRQNFDKIRPGTLFNFSTVSGSNQISVRHCIAVRVSLIGDDLWEVVELTEENRIRAANGGPCSRVNVGFDEMRCLNIVCE